jgi:tocopherol cyclase
MIEMQKYAFFRLNIIIIDFHPFSNYPYLYPIQILYIQIMTQLHSLRPFKNMLSSASYELKKIWNPSWFQGSREKKQYFEGWYFKNVSKEGDHCWSFIPGISLVGSDTHSFVQAINGTTGETWYFRYAAEDFQFSSSGFYITVGPNKFSRDGFELDIQKGENRFFGKVQNHGVSLFPATLSRPGIMGWYRYMPFMECYHGVVSLDHKLSGDLQINGKEISFEDGRGYIEKDWGSSMPKAWIWMQSNHFEQPGASFMLSVARIPWIGKTFTGFLGFFRYNGKTITFATYTGAKIRKMEYSDRETWIEIQSGKINLQVHGTQSELHGKRAGKGNLKAPVLGNMDRVIHESVDAEISVKLTAADGEILFHGKGTSAGLEMVGDMELLSN